jgi:hypothetical protein|tara:strand:- start:101 stop:211 length:111 start_codon:yes stop_codon:yes gene_type:complete
MEKIKAQAMRIYSLALANKKATAVVVAVVVLLIIIK